MIGLYPRLNTTFSSICSPLLNRDTRDGRQSIETVVDGIAFNLFSSISNDRTDSDSTTTCDLYEEETCTPIDQVSTKKKNVRFTETCTVVLIPTRQEYKEYTLDLVELTNSEIAALPPVPLEFSLHHLLWMHGSEYLFYQQHANEEVRAVSENIQERIKKSTSLFALALQCQETTNNRAYQRKVQTMTRNALFEPTPRTYDLKKVVSFIETPSIVNTLSRSDYVRLGVVHEIWGKRFKYPIAKEWIDRYSIIYFDRYAAPFLQYIADEELIGKIESIFHDIRDFIWEYLTN